MVVLKDHDERLLHNLFVVCDEHTKKGYVDLCIKGNWSCVNIKDLKDAIKTELSFDDGD